MNSPTVRELRLASASVTSLITNDIDTIATSLNQSMSQLLTSITTVVGVYLFDMSVDVTEILLLTLEILLRILNDNQRYVGVVLRKASD